MYAFICIYLFVWVLITYNCQTGYNYFFFFLVSAAFGSWLLPDTSARVTLTRVTNLCLWCWTENKSCSNDTQNSMSVYHPPPASSVLLLPGETLLIKNMHVNLTTRENDTHFKPVTFWLTTRRVLFLQMVLDFQSTGSYTGLHTLHPWFRCERLSLETGDCDSSCSVSLTDDPCHSRSD